ncbi:MAG: hypothetical protein ACSHXM_09515 [Paraglaciecola sp.]
MNQTSILATIVFLTLTACGGGSSSREGSEYIGDSSVSLVSEPIREQFVMELFELPEYAASYVPTGMQVSLMDVIGYASMAVHLNNISDDCLIVAPELSTIINIDSNHACYLNDKTNRIYLNVEFQSGYNKRVQEAIQIQEYRVNYSSFFYLLSSQTKGIPIVVKQHGIKNQNILVSEIKVSPLTNTTFLNGQYTIKIQYSQKRDDSTSIVRDLLEENVSYEVNRNNGQISLNSDIPNYGYGITDLRELSLSSLSASNELYELSFDEANINHEHINISVYVNRKQLQSKLKFIVANGTTSALCGEGYSGDDGLVIMEAENTHSPLDLWIIKQDVAGFTGTGHLEFTGNKPGSGPAKSPLSYIFKVEQSGFYRLMLKARKRLNGESSDKSNDGYVRVDGNYSASPLAGDNHRDDAQLEDLKRDVKLFGGDADKWGWAYTLDLGGHLNKRQPIYDFKAGEQYTLTMSGRSKNYNVDKITFFNTELYSTSQAKELVFSADESGCL